MVQGTTRASGGRADRHLIRLAARRDSMLHARRPLSARVFCHVCEAALNRPDTVTGNIRLLTLMHCARVCPTLGWIGEDVLECKGENPGRMAP